MLMNKQILELAKEAGAVAYSPPMTRNVIGYSFTFEQLTKFAELLLAQQSDRIAELDSLQKASIDHLVRGLTAERDQLKADKARLLEALKVMLPLNHNLAWLALCWNDHNFEAKDVFKCVRGAFEEAGFNRADGVEPINNFSEALEKLIAEMECK